MNCTFSNRPPELYPSYRTADSFVCLMSTKTHKTVASLHRAIQLQTVYNKASSMEINIIIEIPVEFANKFYKMLKFVTFGQRSLKEIFAPFVYIIELW